MSRRRAAVAAFLAVFAPGLGHIYLRAWIRAIAWFALATAAVAIVLPESAFGAAESGGIVAVIETSTSLPTRVYLTSLTVRVASALDAGFVALNTSTTDTAETEDDDRCPECGEKLDDDLDFCPWCTARLETRR